FAVFWIGILSATFNQSINRDISLEFLSKALYVPYSKGSLYHSGDLSNRLFRDVGVSVGMLLELGGWLPSSVVTGIVAFAYLAILSWRVAFLTLASGVLSFYIPRFFDQKIYNLSQQINVDRSNLRSHMQETLQATDVIKSNNLQMWAKTRHSKYRNRVYQGEIKLGLLRAYASSSTSIVAEIISLVIGWIIVILAIEGEISAGVLLSAILLVNRVQRPFDHVSYLYSGLQQKISSADRVLEILDLPVEKLKSSETLSKTDKTKETEGVILSFKDITFAFSEDQKPLFKGLSFELKKGEVVGLVGPSGSGKTTLAKIALGFFQPQDGKVEVLGDSLFKDPIGLREFMAYVPQNPYLFAGTVRENLTLGDSSISDQRIIEVLKLANAWEFVAKLDKGLEADIAESGKDLSGGEKQRIALARAFLKNAELVILDEPTSALDNENQVLINEAIERLCKNSSSLVIAHRLSTLKNADRILVLDQGKIVEEGTHRELLALNGLYATLYEMQKSEKSA
ncbi:MAG TPA: ABC transporter ATP-binding protein, partial [Firmicutes bacterium]|nr:ABC transporter ATP-binding protein [Bacillota bacterium]